MSKDEVKVTKPKKSVPFVFLFFLSGVAGLGYEIVWTRKLAVGLGQEIAAILAVLAAFFSGMALGALVLDRVVRDSKNPGRWYALLEAVIGGWGLILIILLPWANGQAAQIIGPEPSFLHHWTVSFSLPFLLLLPATFAMGGSLPAMEALVSRFSDDGWSVGLLYGANTLGAVAGCLAATFYFLPQIGFTATQLLLAGANFLSAVGVFYWAGFAEVSQPPAITHAAGLPSAARIYITLFSSGLLGIGYEVLVVRVVSQVLENTVYSFACILAVYLLGTAIGAASYQKLAPRHSFKGVLQHLLLAMAIFCLGGILVMGRSDVIYLTARNALGGGFAPSIAAELVLASAIFFLPTVIMGATFSHLAQGASAFGYGLGRSLCSNTLGASLAPALFGILLLPMLGAKFALVLVAVGYVFLLPHESLKGLGWAAVPVSLALFIYLSPLQLTFFSLAEGEKVVAHVDGVMAAVTVVEDAQGEFHLKVNNKFQMGGTTSYLADRRQAHIPLLLHADPKQALFLGLGTGGTFAAAADYPGLDAEGVELVPEIVPLMHYFSKAAGDISQEEHLHVKIGDARRYVLSTRKKYDVVVADLFHPARDGAGSLYTVEHFQAIRSILNEDGIFCQWLPVYQLDLDTLKLIVRTFLQVFPEGTAYLANYSIETPMLGLVGSVHSKRYPLNYFYNRIRSESLAVSLQKIGLPSQFELFGCYVADSKALAAFSGKGAFNIDDLPAVVFKAPYLVYSDQQPAYKRLFSLLDASKPSPEQIFLPAETDEERQTHQRVAAYWAARNSFLHAGVNVPRTNDVRQLLTYVREPLLSVVRQSQDFDAAYKPLLAMSRSLYDVDAPAAVELLRELAQANPSRKEASSLLSYIRTLK